jgi:hypothetical protein
VSVDSTHLEHSDNVFKVETIQNPYRRGSLAARFYNGELRWYIRFLIIAVSVALGAVTALRAWDVTAAADDLITGFALVAGVLVAAFTQITAWRTRLEEQLDSGQLRSASNPSVVVDAAASHSLVGVIASTLATVFAVIVEVLPAPGPILQGLLVAASTYVVLLLILIVVTLHVGYQTTFRRLPLP